MWNRGKLSINRRLITASSVVLCLKELDDNGITYDLQDVVVLDVPNIKLPWSV